jgi:hypothetical protein
MFGPRRLVAPLFALALCGSTASGQLVFTITNDATHPASAQMVAGAQQAAALWSARFNDPITITVRVSAQSQPAGVIAHTDTFYDPYNYANVRSAFVTDRSSGDDISATNALPAGPVFSMLINKTANNPNGVVSATPYFDTGLGGPGQAGPENNSTVRLSSANAKALGLDPGHSIVLDGIITFSTAISFDYDRSNGIASNQIDFVGIAAHEMGHLMGFVSGVDVLAGNATAPGLNDNQLPFVTALDLFRFSSRSIGAGGGPGVIDWTDDATAKYFSVDGGLSAIAAFSSGPTFEASHWAEAAPVIGIMDPTAAAGELLVITANDLRAFDAIGYNSVAVPEPSSGLSLLVAGAIGWWRGRRRRQP